MKHIKKILVLVTALVLCMAPLFGTPIKAQAAEPTTFYVKYVASLNQFRFQKGTWDATQEHWDLAILNSSMKDGDNLAVDCTDGRGIILSVDVNLGELTIVNGNVAVITAKSVKTVYALSGTTSAINGDVTTANVYGDATVNFNNNVKVLNLASSGSVQPQGDINVVGTCDELHIENSSNAYSFQKDILRIRDGKLASDTNYFSFTAPTTPSTSSDEYDDVPKTADSRFNPLWLVGLAAVCFAGSVGIKKVK